MPKNTKHLTEEWKEKVRVAARGRVFTKEDKLKMSLAKLGKKQSKSHIKNKRDIRGSKNPNWKGGVVPAEKMLRDISQYSSWRESVFSRDGYACIWCGDNRGGNLQADHIIPFSKILEKLRFEYGVENIYEEALRCELLWDISNGRTLCEPCHKRTESFGKNAKYLNW